MDKYFDDLVNEISIYLPQVDSERLSRAYAISEQTYKDRKENEKLNNFIFRPRDAVKVLISLRPDEDTIIAAFLFDVLGLGRVTVPEMEEEFGEGVGAFLEGLQILKSIRVVRYQSTDKLDLLRKLFLVMAKDIRVLVVLLAVKVVQMDLIEKLPDDCAGAFSNEVMEIFVPIASRLGVYRFKVILEDSCFKCLNKDDYAAIAKELKAYGKKRGNYIDHVAQVLEDFYSEMGFRDVHVSGRLKGYYSIYNKMKKKGFQSMDGIYDIFAFRVVLPSEYGVGMEEDVSKLYEALGMLHSRWRPIASRFKDYVAVPKTNGYRSLHTTVLGISNGDITHPVEIQIRSDDMHEEAEYGIASHWLYKDTRGKGMAMLKANAEWLKNLAVLHADLKSDDKVLDSVKLDLFGDRIYVLTPKGEVKELPGGSTPLDFAYSVHTDIGHRCVLAKVNGKPVPLATELSNGDTVEITTKKDGVPKFEWLSMVRMSQSKMKIRNWFASQDKGKHMKMGRDQLNIQLKRYGKPLLTPNLSALKKYMGKTLNIQDREKVLEEIGKGSKTATTVIRRLYDHEDLLSTDTQTERENLLKKKDRKAKISGLPQMSKDVLVGGVTGLNVDFAKCCTPSFGDRIVAYVSPMKDSATIHKQTCSLLEKLNEERIVSASFRATDDSRKGSLYRVNLRVEADSRVGLLGDLGSTIAANGLNIINHASLGGQDGEETKGISMVLDVSSLEQLELLMNSLEQISGVKSVIKVA
jgi:GTP diphosphokinase / guanosine-3',5'-bis(diphosphate) 3'-diphosphatase